MKQTQIHQKRRQTLANNFLRTLFVISSGSGCSRSHSVQYRFKVASDFFYLTGLEISDAILIVAGTKTYLVQPQNQDYVWGEFNEISDEQKYLLSEIELLATDDFEKVISELSLQFDRVAAALGRSPKQDEVLMKLVGFQRSHNRQRKIALQLVDSRALVGSIRLTKDQHEIENMKTAAERSSSVHRLLLQQNLVGKTEREVSNWIEAQFLLQNMQWCSYETIVGTGSRSTILHARASDRRIQRDDLVLVDAGAEWKGYCADITRTLPAGKFFSAEQKWVYQIVLKAQKAALNFIRPGVTLQEIHQLVLEQMQEELQKKVMMQRVMPHSTSHWIGLDVHDPCAYLDDNGQAIRLQAGMCFTVEPGLYFNRIEGFEKYDGIGIRIEDDVIVSEEGCHVLSSAPKEIEEIEQLRAIDHTC